jgi:hypothetical protein|tara:strand:+ start:562 stop:732 length:171 start_codon:yes stop_codon:yes gene_type:complete
MAVYKVTFVEETTNVVLVKAETEEKAREMVNSGDFSGDEVTDRDHFEITKVDKEGS